MPASKGVYRKKKAAAAGNTMYYKPPVDLPLHLPLYPSQFSGSCSLYLIQNFYLQSVGEIGY
jgi:hypothetical protein